MAVQPQNKGIKIAILWLPVVFWMGVIFYASSTPGTDIPSLFPYQDILFHSMVYAALAFFLKRALKNSYQDLTARKAMALTVAVCILYGISDELHQLLVPHRIASFFDVGIDSIGSFMGSLLYR